jgi:hypothetical protein
MHRVLALGAERAWLLRRAAHMDRMALHDPGPGPVGAAAQTAGQRVLHDRRHPERVALERRNGGRRLAFGWWSCLRASVSLVPRTRTRPRSGDATRRCTVCPGMQRNRLRALKTLRDMYVHAAPGTADKPWAGAS